MQSKVNIFFTTIYYKIELTDWIINVKLKSLLKTLQKYNKKKV